MAIETPFQFAVIIERTVQHEGDERSRTHPGHGYPAYTETVHEFKEFKTEAEFRAWIERAENRKYGRTTYRPIAFKPVVVSTTINIQS